jgi:hypothetical protein
MTDETAERKDALGAAVGTVTYLFAAFNGALEKMAPPEQQPAGVVATTLARFGALFLLLLIGWLAARRGKRRFKAWAAASAVCFFAALLLGMRYYRDLNTFTYVWPEDDPKQQALHVRGTFTHVFDYESFRAGGIPKVFAENGDQDPYAQRYSAELWTLEAEQGARRILDLEYVWLAILLATSVFCLTHGLVAGRR